MRLRKLAERTLTGVLILGLGVLAYLHPGVSASEVDLNDGGVWVTNPASGLVAHLNYQSRTLDGGFDPQSRSFDVSQEGNAVVLHDKAVASVAGVETATMTMSAKVSLPGFSVSQGGTTVLIADPDKGRVWATSAKELPGFVSTQSPLVEGLEKPRVVVGRDGIGFAVTASGEVIQIKPEKDKFVVGQRSHIAGEVTLDTQITVVGKDFVAVDEGKVRTTTRTLDVVQIDGTSLVQQPGLTSGDVAIATKDSLLRVPLDGSQVVQQNVAAGSPVAPAEVAGCVYGAWTGSGAYLRDCAGTDQDLVEANAMLAKARQAVFRVSREVVAINDAAGNVYLPNDGMAIINNWDLVRSQLEEEDKKDNDASDEKVQNEPVVENAEQEPPVAYDDEFGARPGTTTTLPVLLNDTDPDGDVLTVNLVDVPQGVDVSLGKDGRTAQITLPPNQKTPARFTYRAFDGQDTSNTATVVVTPQEEEANSAPYRERDKVIAMAEQATVTYSVLPDWVDPEGDPIYLVNAVGDDGMAVTFRQDGYLSLRDLGTAGAGRRTVDITVSDGRQETTASLRVQVAPGATNLPPIANADHYTVNVGEEVIIRPLSNDSDPNGEALTLAEVSKPAQDEQAKIDYQQGTIIFSSTRVGAHEMTYVVSDGPNSAQGKIRIDVNDPDAADNRPSAQNDLALLPANSSVLVAVLDNDHDPAGGVLSIQSVSLDQGSGLSVEIINHSQLRISAPVALTKPKTFSYTISNGQQAATARVLVLPQSPQQKNDPPTAADDIAVVRVNDVVTIPVLDNDFSPNDLEISLDQKVEVRGNDLGEVFVTKDVVRFKAGDKAGSTSLIYTVVDSAGNRASAKVQLTVRSFDTGNQRPTPKPVVGRVFAGNTVLVAVPLDGVDPDGDSVELVEGASQGPKLGSVRIREGYLEYKAQPSAAGTDSFTYRVKDRFGQTGEATVQIGVMPAPGSNQPPVAVPDQITVRPGQKVEIPVMANDVDPDGDEITIVDGSATALAPWQAQLKVVGQKVQFTSPQEEGSYRLSYDITDGRAEPVTGYATVTVDKEALLLPPVAVDDRVAASEIQGRTEVEVSVLDNDHDPDGPVSDLTVAVEKPGAIRNGKVVVPLQADAQVVLYTITDADGLSAKAAVFVPGAEQLPPMLRPEKLPAKVKGGQTLRIDLAEYVQVRAGHTAKLTSARSVVAQRGGNQEHPTQGLVVVSDTVIELATDKAFYGPTTVTFEVHDGDSVEDPRGLRSTLSIPIEVTAAGLTTPTLRPSPIEVAQGEPANTVSLRSMVDDPDEGDNERMKFSLVSSPASVVASISGQSLTISAAPNTPPSTGDLVVRVHDGSTDPVEMTIPVKVVTSTRPLMSIAELRDSNGRVGQAKTFNLASAITNPFADQGGQITILNATVRSGQGTASLEGMNLSLTPSAVGELIVNYIVQDATKQANRQVVGQVVLAVKDLPAAPNNLTAKSDIAQTVELSWTQGDLRGGTLDSFLVMWNGGQKNCGTATNCRITGLRNNTDYTFRVSQVTEVGQSVASNPVTARPDVKPNQPSVPTTKFGDRLIDVSWDAVMVPDGGSPVTGYNVEVKPAVNGQTVFKTTSTFLRLTGLENGRSYAFRVQAINRYAENNVARASEYLWSDWSAADRPAGAPAAPTVPRVEKDAQTVDRATRATVSWNAPRNGNGDESFRYELRQKGSTNIVYSGTASRTTVMMDISTEDRRFEVRATNKSGLWSPWTEASNAVRSFQPPGAPTNFILTPTGNSNSVRFSFGAAEGNGAKSNEITYRWNAGGASGTVRSGDIITNSIFVNGSNVKVTLTAIATVNGETVTGGSATAVANAYGQPSVPSLSVSGDYRAVTFVWKADLNSGGRPLTISIYENSPDEEGAIVKASSSGSITLQTEPGAQRCLTVEVRSTADNSAKTTKCGKSWASATWQAERGAARPCPSWMTPGQTCTWYMYRLERWKPNSVVYCTDVSERWGSRTMRVVVDGSGNWYGVFDPHDGSGGWAVTDSYDLGIRDRFYQAIGCSQ